MVPLVPSLLPALSFYVSGQRTVHPAKAYSPNDLEEAFWEVHLREPATLFSTGPENARFPRSSTKP